MASTSCPHCGGALNIVAGNAAPSLSSFGTAWQTGTELNAAVSTPWSSPAEPETPPAFDAERRAPARPASMESDVFVPLSQSFATGVALLIPGIGITIWQGWPWWSPLVISGGGVTVTWLYLLNAHRKLLWLVETISHIDLNRDGDTGQPKPEPVTVEVKHTDNGRLSSMQYIDLPDGTTHQQFTDWARGVSSGVKTPARKYWAGTGKPFSRDGYDSFLDAMERAGIVTRSGNNARILTNGGKRAMARVAKTA